MYLQTDKSFMIILGMANKFAAITLLASS